MAGFVVKNNAESLVADNPLASGATTLNVTSGEGDNFPSTFPYRLTIWDDENHADPTDDSGMEIVECTGRSGDALTIVRGKEGTSDVDHANGERVAMLITAGLFNDIDNGILCMILDKSVMMNAIIAACDGNGVLDGLTVSENGAGADMSVDVTAGSCIISGTKYTESSTTNLAISAADATYDRKDLVTYDPTTPAPIVTTGTAAATPIPPDIPAGDILLAIVDVGAAATQITNADLTDGIVIVGMIEPPGIISMWHGTLATIPCGWVLCDGTNGTPDLRDKFVRGAAAAANPGATGGEDTHTLTVSEMPAHTHSYQEIGAETRADGDSITGTYSSASATGSTGGGAAHNNIPAYYAIAYIMKT